MSKSSSDRTLRNARHSLAHLLAVAVLTKFPKAKLGIGPTIENGFYYDFKVSRGFTPEDLKEFEKEMKALIKTGLPFKGKKVTPPEARKLFKDQPFKLELIKDFVKEKKSLTAYSTGDVFVDLCRGGHVKNTKEINPSAFKLTSISGAYWKGDENNPQLQRVYGVAFETKKELTKHLEQLEEIRKRDHRVLGMQLELFMFDKTAPGSPYWLPNGLVIYNELIKFWREEHIRRGYQEISTPLINKKDLWITSGHWEHFKDEMFIADMGKGEVYGVKAMNCPNTMVVFGSKLRSYRDLPLRLSDSDILHRYERSGTLNGLFRVRSFKQDDSHNFVTEDQIESEYAEIFEIVKRFYNIFGLEFKYRLGTRPDKFIGDPKTWTKAENALKRILTKSVGKDGFLVLKGDGAFYGPKVDIIMKDGLGRDWQMGTIQLDFQMPRRFKLKYVDKDGSKKTPIVIHRVIYGSLERFIGILIEHFGGAFPTWLAPVQAQVLPVSQKQKTQAKKVFESLLGAGVRVELTPSNETLGKRIREGELQKIPYILVVGDKETKTNSVAVRRRGKKDIKTQKLTDFVEEIQKEIEKRK